MVTKKRVVLVVLLILVVAGTAVSARAMGRGGFAPAGAGAVVAESVEVDSDRPVQRWQTLTEEEIALCPLCVEGVDRDALIRFQEARAEARMEAVAARDRAPMSRERSDNKHVQSGRNAQVDRRPVSGKQSAASVYTRTRSGR